MIIYLSIWALLGGLSLKNLTEKIPTSNYHLLIILFLSILVGFRYEVGTDWRTYTEIYYYAIPEIAHWTDLFLMEPFFCFIGVLCYNLGFSHCIFFCILCFVSLYVLTLSIKRFEIEYFYVSLLVFFSLFFFQFELNVVRHGIMASFVWLAFSHLKNGNKKYCFISIVIAAGFHSLALCLIFAPFFLHLRLAKWFVVICIPTLFFLLFTHVGSHIAQLLLSKVPVIGDKIIFYMNSYYSYGEVYSYGLTLGTLLNLSVFLYSFFVLRNFYLNNMGFRICVNSLFMSFVFTCVLNDYSVFIERTVSLFNMAQVFVYPYILKVSFCSKSSRIIGFIVVCVYLLMAFYMQATVKSSDKQGYQFIPYQMEVHIFQDY